MDIPVFVSCATSLSAEQDCARKIVLRLLKRYKLEPRALGRSDYPTELPLREVLGIARHCAGGIILGFEQFRSLDGISRPGAPDQLRATTEVSFPTPWNHLESGILFGLGLPLLIFKEDRVTGGVFDSGVTDVFVQPIPDSSGNNGLNEVFLKWQAKVRTNYYDQ
jgi:hypothetical protein